MKVAFGAYTADLGARELCRDGARVRCFTRGGYDWADRFPAIVEAWASSRIRS